MSRRQIIELFALVTCLSAIHAQSQTPSNQPAAHSAGLNEAEAAHHKCIPRFSGHALSAIATNTPAFDEYAFHLMLHEAERVRASWKLKRVPPLNVQNVTWDAIPTKDGVLGGIATPAFPFYFPPPSRVVPKHGVESGMGPADRRFVWRFSHNTLEGFDDSEYCPSSFNHSLSEIDRLAKIKSKITARQAEELARGYLHGIGVAATKQILIEPPLVTQWSLTNQEDGSVQVVPMFTVAWTAIDSEPPEADVTFDISGITEEVASYFNALVYAPSPKIPRPPLPTNYLDMLGVLPPTNASQRHGLKPWPHK